MCKHHYLKKWREEKEKDGDTRKCKVSDCTRMYHSKGMCKRHYEKSRSEIPDVRRRSRKAGEKYDKSEHGQKHRVEYKKTPAAKKLAKKRGKRYRESPHGRAHGQAYRQLPEVKEANKKSREKYVKTEKYKETIHAWRNSPKQKAKEKAYNDKFNKSPEGQKYKHDYVRSPRGKKSLKKGKRTYQLKHPEKLHDPIFDPIKLSYVLSINDECEWDGCRNTGVDVNHILTKEFCDRYGISEFKHNTQNLIGFCPLHHYIWHYLHWHVAGRKTPHYRILGMMENKAVDYCKKFNLDLEKMVEYYNKKFNLETTRQLFA